MRVKDYKEVDEARQILSNIEIKQKVIDDMTAQIKEGLSIVKRKLVNIDPEIQVLKEDF